MRKKTVKNRDKVLLAGSGFVPIRGNLIALKELNNQFYNYLRGQGLSVLDAHATANARYPHKGLKKSKSKRPQKNPSLIQPFKVVIGATAKRGHKTMMWFDGKHFRTTRVKRAMFSSVHNAKVMALSLLKRFPVLSKYTVGVYRA